MLLGLVATPQHYHLVVSNVACTCLLLRFREAFDPGSWVQAAYQIELPLLNLQVMQAGSSLQQLQAQLAASQQQAAAHRKAVQQSDTSRCCCIPLAAGP